jgi:hypothetical protein
MGVCPDCGDRGVVDSGGAYPSPEPCPTCSVESLQVDNNRLRKALAVAADALDAAANEMLGMDRRIHERVKLANDHPDEFPITTSDHSVLGATLWGRGCDASTAASAARKAADVPDPRPIPLSQEEADRG